MPFYIFSIVVFFFSLNLPAQEASDIVEVHGITLTKSDNGRYEYVPYVNITVVGENRGTYANYNGMYSIVIKKGQKLRFSAIGYKTRTINIDKDTEGLYKSLTVELETEEIVIEEIIVFPWPDRDNLTAEFLAMQPGKAGQLESIAKDNLDKGELLTIAANTKMDGNENAAYYLKKQSRDYSYQGQQSPQSIFDPIAWGKFFNQMKKKKMSSKEEKMLEILEGENPD